MASPVIDIDETLGALRQLADSSPEMKRRVEGALARLLGSLQEEGGPSTVAIARATIATRQRRADVLGRDLFRDPAWDMLLDLYVAGTDRATSVTSLCAAANVPTTTGLRYIAAMEQEGFLHRRPDMRDHRRTLIDPDRRTMEGVSSILRRLGDAIC